MITLLATNLHLVLSNRHLKCLLGLLFSIGSLTAATINGYIKEASTGSALEGARVVVTDLNLQTYSTRNGYFEFSNVPAGQHELRFHYVGAGTATRSVDLSEGDIHTVSVDLETRVIELEAYVVVSANMNTFRAANMQRTSENLREVVASDFFGSFADTNAAEALNRLPGVSVERDQGEGRFVVIRGIDPGLNSVSIDGVALASPSSDSRSTLLDTIPIDVLDTLEVTKAVLPDQPGDSIGGHINLRTPSAFDAGTNIGSISAASLYSDLVEEWGYRINGSYSYIFGPNSDWGLHVAVHRSERTFGSDNVESDEWEDDGDGYISETFEYRDYDLTRERTGISASLEYRPTAESLYFIRGSFNDYTDYEERDLSETALEGDFSNVSNNGFQNDEAESVLELKMREESMIIWLIQAGGENKVDNWTIDYTLSHSHAEEETPFDFEAVYELDGTSVVSFSDTNTYNPKLSFVGDLDYRDPGNYAFDEIANAHQTAEEDDYTGMLNLQYDADQGALEYVKFGGLVRQKSKDNNPEEYASDDNPESVDSLAGWARAGGNRDFLNSAYPSIDPGIRSFFLNNVADFAMERDEEASIVEDYETDETVYAAYLMTSLEVADWEIIAGLRMERTEFETDGFLFDNDNETVSTRSADKSYTNWMPGIHLRKNLSEDVVFRASWTTTIARPNFEQASAFQFIDVDGGDGEAVFGNPDLDPYEASNLDVSIQVYSDTLGLFSVAGFYKSVDSFIYSQVIPDGYTDGENSVDLETFRNGEDGNILGLELNYQRSLDFISPMLSSFTFGANLTLTSSEATVLPAEAGDPSRDLSFIKQSDTVGNISLSWEWNRYFIRLSASYRDDYLDEVGGEPLEDRYIDSLTHVDLSANVNISQGLTLFLELNNLNNAPLLAYWGESGRISQFEEYGISGALGAKFNF